VNKGTLIALAGIALLAAAFFPLMKAEPPIGLLVIVGALVGLIGVAMMERAK